MAEVSDSDLQQMREIEEYMEEHGLLGEEAPQGQDTDGKDGEGEDDDGYAGDDPEIAYEVHMVRGRQYHHNVRELRSYPAARCPF